MKLQVPLADMEKYLFRKSDAPNVVYHLTTREKVNDILASSRLKCYDDYVCWVCKSIDDVLEYIEIFGRDSSDSLTHDTNGNLVHYAPWNASDMVILKLIPKTSPSKWFIEDLASRGKGLPKKMQRKLERATNCRLAHYGNMRFCPETAEIIELEPYYDAYVPKWRS